jgi:hypothetical protein
MAAELANANRQLDANTTLLTQLVADNRRLSSQLRDALDQMAAAQRILDGTVQGQDKSAIATSVLAQLAATAKRFQDLPTGSPDRAILQQDLRIYAGILTRQTGQSVPADIHALLGQDP